MSYNARAQWSEHFLSHQMAYPAEYVIRIFKGSYPKLAMQKSEPGNRVLDVGCGDGRHMALFRSLGLESYGVEISDQIVGKLQCDFVPLGVPANNIRVGSCASIPFEDAYFDYVLAWNSCYYMSLDEANFERHAIELSRVVKPGGWLVLSVPKPSSFIFRNSEPTELPGYQIVRDDPFGSRNGEVLRMFQSQDELEAQFSAEFENWSRADIHDDCFGFAYHWFISVGEKTT